MPTETEVQLKRIADMLEIHAIATIRSTYIEADPSLRPSSEAAMTWQQLFARDLGTFRNRD